MKENLNLLNFEGITFRVVLNWNEVELFPAIYRHVAHVSLNQSKDLVAKFRSLYDMNRLHYSEDCYLRDMKHRYFIKEVTSGLTHDSSKYIKQNKIIEGSAFKTIGGFCLFEITLMTKSPKSNCMVKHTLSIDLK